MATLNQVSLIGRFTRDPELRTTPKGTAVAQAGIAINRKFKTADGAEKEEVAFFDVEFWGRTAEITAKYCRKGAEVFIGGRLACDSWEDKQTGQKRSKVKVVADNIQFLGGKSDAPSAGKTAAPAADNSGADDSAPF